MSTISPVTNQSWVLSNYPPIDNSRVQSRQTMVRPVIVKEQPKKFDTTTKLCVILNPIAFFVAMLVLVLANDERMLYRKSFEKTLAKYGAELRGDIAYIKGTDKKFTGTVKRKIIPLSCFSKKNVTKYVDGLVKEDLYYDYKGKELYGSFYKDGEIFRSVDCEHDKKYAVCTEYGRFPEGIIREGKINGKKSIFEQMRQDKVNYVKDLRKGANNE